MKLTPTVQALDVPLDGQFTEHCHLAEYEPLFSRLVASADHTTPQQARLLKTYLEAFILTLLEGEMEQDPTRVAMHEVASYMHAHLDHSLTIAEVARQFAM